MRTDSFTANRSGNFFARDEPCSIVEGYCILTLLGHMCLRKRGEKRKTLVKCAPRNRRLLSRKDKRFQFELRLVSIRIMAVVESGLNCAKVLFP